MKKIAALTGLLMMTALSSFAQATVTLPMTDIASAEICAGQSVTITASAAAKGNALDFNGSTQSALVPNSSSVSLSGSSNFTVSCWIYPRSNNLQTILYHGFGCSTWASWALTIGGTESADAAWAKKLAFYFRTSNASASKSVVSNDTLVLDQWVHATVTYDGSDLKLYINGVLDKTSVATGTPWNSTENFSMGADLGCSGRNYYNGKLDEVQIWNKTRSATEIAASYNTIAPPSTPNLAAYWRFDENSGLDIFDVGINKNHGTTAGVGREIPSTAPLPAMSTSAITFSWSPATGLSATTGATVSASPLSTTNYTVKATNTVTGDTNTNIVRIKVNPPAATPVAPSPVTYCKDVAATALTATKGSASDTLFWYTTATGGTGSKTAPTPSTATTGTTLHFVSAKSNKGCEGERDTIEVIVNPAPVAPTVSTPVIYCQNATATALTATAGSSADTLYWYTAATGGTGSLTAPTPSTATAGSSSRFVVTRNTLNCESSRVKIDITINPKGATPTVTTPVHYCKEEPTVALTATKGSSSDTLFWYTAAAGGTGSKTAPTPSSATTGTTSYYVSAKTELGCEGDRAVIKVQVNPIADTPGVTTPVVYCQKDKAIALTATKGASSDTLLWYTTATGGTASRTAPIPSTAIAGSTLYYVSGKTSFGCESGRDTIEVIVQPEPVVTVSSLSPTGTIHCRNADSVLLRASAPTAIAYQWYYEKTLVTGSVYDTVYARKTGYWAAVVTDAKGCRNKDSVWVQRDTLEDPVLTPSESKICMGASVLLTCHPGYVANRFKWFRNDMSLAGIPLTSNTVTASDTGTYSVEMTNAGGCTYPTNKARVDFYPLPPKPILVYMPPVLSITGGTYRAYQWYRDATWIFSATGSTHTVSGKGKYYVEVTDANGCTRNSDTLEIDVPNSINPQYLDMRLKLYPNPTIATVILEAPVSVNVVVTDRAGKTLLTVPAATTIDLAGFADGTYFFRILDEHKQVLGVEKINKISAP